MNHYQVVFSGETVDGADAARVRQNVARMLGIDDRKVAQLFSGRTVVLKSRASQTEAESLQAQLSEAGALARVRNLSPDERAKYKVDSRAPGQTLKDITAAHVECPRCGHMQLDTEFCARCGVDIASAARDKQKEDLLIQKRIRELRGQRTSAGGRRSSAPIRPNEEGPIAPRRKPAKKRLGAWFSGRGD